MQRRLPLEIVGCVRHSRRAVSNPTHGIGHQFIAAPSGPRAFQPERRDGGHDEPRIARTKRGRRDTGCLQARHRQVGDEDVGRREQPIERPPSILAVDIEDDAALVDVEIEKQAARLGIGSAVRKWSAPPRRVAFGAFDLDDLRAEVAEQLGGIGTGGAVA
jgi:hypothetical protein